MIKPKHIAFIMDGNGRWATERGLSRSEGHLAGTKAVRIVLTECVRNQIPFVTLYAFSTENWNRPQEEVSTLFKLFCEFVQKELPLMIEKGIKLSMIGDKERIPLAAKKALDYAIKKTAKGENTELILALNYSGSQELVHAAKQSCLGLLQNDDNLERIQNSAKNIKALKAELSKIITEQYTDQTLKNCLYHARIPDPDLIVRTGGELRLSNFYLLQAAYAELYFSDVYWPDFSGEDFELALNAFANRKRRFGKI